MTIRLRGVRKGYRGRAALAGVDLDLAEGTLTVITGPNGAGKSTLLRCIAGVAGHDGSLARNGSSRAAIAYLPQANALPPAARVGEVLRLFGASGAGLEEWLPFGVDRLVGELSGGERRRVALASILSLDAGVLLLDEPFADLDESASAALAARLAELRDGGAIVVVTSPEGDLSRIRPLTDRTVRLAAGVVAEAVA